MARAEESEAGSAGHITAAACLVNTTVGLSLPDELSRRLNIGDPVLHEVPTTLGPLQLRLFCEERHDASEDAPDSRSVDRSLVSKWRQKEKLKTTAVALVLCLNIGVDPPDVIKISPCARLECWVDPLSMQPAKALETIGKNLQAQYERWQSRAKYKMHLDPTLDDVKKLCASCRRTAKNERVLFHYNGHGVPRPTVNGEIWVFNSRYTQYIPLSMYELQAWLGTPCIYVLDCSAAGFIVNSFRAMMDNRQAQLLLQQQAAAAAGDPAAAALGGLGGGVDPMKEVIVLAACQGHELLPQNPDLPADVFTACLTTPIRVALRWFCSRSLLKQEGWTKELLERIPGRQTDRKTPLGELNWIFTAITDTIAWNCLPRALFQKLFRQDLLVASLFRNFLLAERIMVAANCTPISYPRLPPTHQHPVWASWDMAVETCLLQLPGLLADPPAEFQPSSFFSEQLTAFELWLAHGSADKKPPEQLPIVLQVLLSQVHRLRALVLLGRFLDMGSWAVDLALSVGIFPYVLKLLQTTSMELRTTLVFIWAKILALDRSCQADLVKDNGHLYFLKYLEAPEPGVTEGQHAQAAFVLAMVCDQHPKGQALCAAAQLPQTLLKALRLQLPELHGSGGAAFLSKWLCLCLGKVADGVPEVCGAATREGAQDLLAGLLGAPMPELRAAAVYALGCLISPQTRRADLAAAVAAAAAGAPPPSAAGAAEAVVIAAEQSIVLLMLRASIGYDASPLVRAEVAVALARLVKGHAPLLTEAVAWMQDSIAAQQRRAAELMRASSRSTPRSTRDGVLGSDPSSASGRSGFTASPSTAAAAEAGPGSSSSAAGSVGMGSVPAAEAAAAAGGAAAVWEAVEPYPPDASGEHGSTGLYCAVLELVLLLATDPAPRVAAYGKKVLQLVGLDLAPLTAAAGTTPRVPVTGSTNAGGSGHYSQGGSVGSSSSSHTGAGWAIGGSPQAGLGSGQVPLGSAAGSAGGSHLSASLGNLTSKLVKGAGRNWRSGFSGSMSSSSTAAGAAVGSARAAPVSVSSTPSSSSSPPSPHRDWPGVMYGRNPYILRSTSSITAGAAAAAVAGSSSSLSQQPSSSGYGLDLAAAAATGGGGAAGGGLPPAGTPLSASNSSIGTTFAGEELGLGSSLGGGGGGGLLPQSQIFQLSCEYFSRPMLEPMASAWRELEAPKLTPWVSPPDVARRAQRQREMEAARQRCHGVTAPRMREQVRTFDLVGEAPLSSVVFHSFHLLLVTVDLAGMVRVNNGVEGTTLNAFHISNGLPTPDAGSWCGSSAPVMFMRQLNEAESNLLLTCAADGGVRVWRNYLTRGAQRMATAWQAVPLRQPPCPSPTPACFALGDVPRALYAAGGSHPDVLHRWDLLSEKCTHQLPARSSSSQSSCPVALEMLSVGGSDPFLVLGSCSDAVLRLYDIRCPSPVAAIAAGPSHITGMVLEPCRRPAVIATGSERGELRFMDLRALSDSDTSGGPNPGGPSSSSLAVHDPTLSSSSSSGGPGGLPGSSSSSSSNSTPLSSTLVRSVEAFSKTSLTTLVAHPNAPLIATGSTSGIVKVWSDTGDAVGAQRQVAVHSQHKANPVTSMAWHPFNLYLASVGLDSSATVYIIDNLPTAAPAAAAAVAGDSTPRVGGGGLSPASSPVHPSHVAS